jgi:hypothetical protein
MSVCFDSEADANNRAPRASFVLICLNLPNRRKPGLSNMEGVCATRSCMHSKWQKKVCSRRSWRGPVIFVTNSIEQGSCPIGLMEFPQKAHAYPGKTASKFISSTFCLGIDVYFGLNADIKFAHPDRTPLLLGYGPTGHIAKRLVAYSGSGNPPGN